MTSGPFDPRARILVVDDFPAWSERICTLIESVPELQVIGRAWDGLQAVQKAAELKPDLVLLDIGLPSINGLEAASRIMGNGTFRSKILFVSENRDPDVVAKALSCPGVFGYLCKSDAHSDLLRGVAAVLRGEEFVSPGLKGFGFFPAGLVLT